MEPRKNASTIDITTATKETKSTPLLSSLTKKDITEFQFLMARESDKFTNQELGNALTQQLLLKNFSKVILLLNHVPDDLFIFYSDSTTKNQPLHIAATLTHEEIIQKLLARGAFGCLLNINKEGNTALDIIIKNKQTKLLVDNMGYANATQVDTIILYLAQIGQWEFIQEILEKRPYIRLNAQEMSSKNTALHYAAEAKNIKLVTALAKCTTHLLQNDKEQTPLSLSIENEDVESACIFTDYFFEDLSTSEIENSIQHLCNKPYNSDTKQMMENLLEGGSKKIGLEYIYKAIQYLVAAPSEFKEGPYLLHHFEKHPSTDYAKKRDYTKTLIEAWIRAAKNAKDLKILADHMILARDRLNFLYLKHSLGKFVSGTESNCWKKIIDSIEKARQEFDPTGFGSITESPYSPPQEVKEKTEIRIFTKKA